MVICGTWLFEMRHDKGDAVKEEPVERRTALPETLRAGCGCKFLILFLLIYSHEGFLKDTSKHFVLKFVFLLVAFMHLYFIWWSLKNQCVLIPLHVPQLATLKYFHILWTAFTLWLWERWKRNSYIDFLIP